MAVVLIRFYADPRAEKQLNEFHENKIEGIVTDEYSSSGGTRININKEKKNRYILVQYNNEVKSFFSSFVEKGDSVFKAPNSEILYLYRDGKEYKFRTKRKNTTSIK